jgi:threonine dehydrogenase-like Zn-dependent dehydrogenase
VRALIAAGDGVEVGQVPDPAPGQGEVVVRVEACGICGSDVHAVEHGEVAAGRILGHEFAGQIAALGPGVTEWQPGQPVAVNPLGSCGDCLACGKGMPLLCGVVPNLGLSAPGGYAEYVAVPAAQLVALPADVPPEVGAHAEPLAVALQAVELAGAGPGEAALVYGVGTIGLNVIMALRLAGASQIVAAGRSGGRRAAAAAAGASIVLDTRDTDVPAFLAEAGIRCGSAYECSGAASALDETLSVLAPGGTSVQLALTPGPSPVHARQLAARGLRVVGSCAFTAATYQRAVGYLTSGQVDGGGLISERVPLAAGPDALLRLRRPGDLVRVLVQPWR